MQLVETIEVGAGGAASIEFTSIPQDADDLLLVCSLRANDNTATSGYAGIQFSGITTSSYTRRFLQGSGSATSSSTGTDVKAWIGRTSHTGATANTFSSHSIYIPNYALTVAKSVSVDSVNENNATDAYQVLTANSTSFTNAITSIKIIHHNAHDFAQYSTASLYKITKA